MHFVFSHHWHSLGSSVFFCWFSKNEIDRFRTEGDLRIQGYHLYLIARNTTTNESFKWSDLRSQAMQAERQKKKIQLSNQQNPFRTPSKRQHGKCAASLLIFLFMIFISVVLCWQENKPTKWNNKRINYHKILKNRSEKILSISTTKDFGRIFEKFFNKPIDSLLNQRTKTFSVDVHVENRSTSWQMHQNFCIDDFSSSLLNVITQSIWWRCLVRNFVVEDNSRWWCVEYVIVCRLLNGFLDLVIVLCD